MWIWKMRRRMKRWNWIWALSRIFLDLLRTGAWGLFAGVLLRSTWPLRDSPCPKWELYT